MNDLLSPWAKPTALGYNAQHPLTRGLIAYWIFNEVKGTRVRNVVAPSKYIGTIASANISWAASKYGIGLNNTGAVDDTGVAISSGPAFGTGSAWALEVLLKNTTQGNNDYQGVISDGVGNGQLFLNGGVVGTITWWNGGQQDAVAKVPLNVWTHLVLTTGSGTGGNYYINGVKDANTFNSVAWTLNNLLSANTGDSGFKGICEYVRVWNRRLTQAEVAQLYAAPYAMHNFAPWIASVIASGGGGGAVALYPPTLTLMGVQ